MNWALKQLVAPSVTPVTLVELKSQVHITHAVQDDTLTAYLEAGTKHAEEYQRRSYITQDWVLSLDCLPLAPIKLLRGPVQELLSVTVYDVDNTAYIVDNSNFYLSTNHEPAVLALTSSGAWPSITPRGLDAVEIAYRAGYGDDGAKVPADVKHAIKLFAAFADDNRAADEATLPRAIRDLLTNTRVDTNGPW